MTVSHETVDAACAAAARVDIPLARRAPALRAVAGALREHAADLVELADAETHLGPVRLTSEVERAARQLEMFADAVDEGSVHEAVIDLADPAAQPAPRPDLRRLLAPIGPVAVFAASNFPLAFSVAGADTASALAAGCPVVVKANPGHERLSVRCGQLVSDALGSVGLPTGAFGVVYGFEAGAALVRHPTIRAVGFTGSLRGGRALFDLAVSRPDPIPFHGELGSLNPVVVTPGALASRGSEIVAGYVGSYTLGSGQFCTKPGLLLVPRGHGLDDALREAVGGATLVPLLTPDIRTAYDTGAARLADAPGVRSLVPPTRADAVSPTLLAVGAAELTDELLDECFGPCSLVVEYEALADLPDLLDRLPGSLAMGLHATDDELPGLTGVVDTMSRRAGRVLYNGWPTGVAVTWAMQHGGPWPATTSPLHSSVGVTAIRRWQRPVVYQATPDALLPAELRDANPLGLPRRVNGHLTREPITLAA